MVVDEAFFQSMGRDVAETQGYIVSFFNAVNMRFATVRVILSSLNLCQMTSPLVELSIAGMVVAESSSSLPYMLAHTSRGDMLDAPSCLHAMGQYYYKLPK